MTDLCDEPDAETKCEEHVQAAITSDELCLDGYQSLANLRLVRGRNEEAR
jgi:hypothetical protein